MGARAWLLAAAVLASTGTTWVSAAGADEDHEQARRLRDQGTILPLQEILNRLGRLPHARVLDVGLEHEGERYLYEVELLSPWGRVWKYKFDAHTGQVLETENRR